MFRKLSFRNPYLDLLKTAWRYAQEEKGRFTTIYVFFLINSLISFVFPFIWGTFIDHAQQDPPGMIQYTWIYALTYFFLGFLSWAFHGPARVWEQELAFRVSKNFTDELYQKTVSLPVQWHQDNHSGSTIDRINKATQSLRGFFSRGFMFLYTFAKFILSFIAIIYFAPLFGSIALLMGVGIVFVISRFDKPYVSALKEVNEKEHIVSSNLFDSLSNIITVITLRLEKRMRSGLMEKISNVFPPFSKATRVNETKWFAVSMCINFMYVFIVMGYIYQNYVPGETFLFGGLVALVAYIHRFTAVFHDISWQYTAILEYDTDIKAAKPIQDAYEEYAEAHQDESLALNWRHIYIKELNFEHKQEESDKPIPGLKDVSLQIEKGKRIALIGESGSGKSTLLALLRGLFQAKGAEVSIDEHAFDKLDVIAAQVSLFPQEPEIFENTIEYNITLGLTYDQQELNDICEAVHFSEVIAQLPNGLASSIREKGVNLSGGQKQRLALARGVFAARDSQIILLDEPTSSVDPKTELQIYDRLFERFREKAVISALHRMHLLPKFDHICVMENGKIVDQGSFDELYERSTTFRELYEHQEAQV